MNLFQENVLPRPLILPLLVSVGLTACGTANLDSASQEPATTASTPQNRKPGNSEDLWSRVGALPAQRVPPGSCGLFLWANMPERTLVYYSDNKTAESHIQLDGRQVALPRFEASGGSLLGHFFRQSFKNEQLLLTVSFKAEIKEGLNQGAIVRGGALRIQETSGWEIVAPVAGLIGCN